MSKMDWTEMLQIATDMMTTTYSVTDDKEVLRKILFTWLDSLPKSKQGKLPSITKGFKKGGHLAFKKKNYQESVGCYTKCMMYSDFESDDYFEAAAYRSVSLFYLKNYEESIKNVDDVMKWNCSPKMGFTLNHQAGQSFKKLNNKELMTKYFLRAKMCLQNCSEMTQEEKDNKSKFVDSLMSESANEPDSSLHQVSKEKPEPAFGENSSFSNASSGLSVKSSAKKGRFVVANKDFEKGQILVVERPFASVLLDYAKNDSICAHCCRAQLLSPTVCCSCSDVVYCDKDCRDQAWNNYHQWECEGNKMGLWRQIGIGHLALNIFLRCLTTKDLEKFNQVQSLVTNSEELPDKERVAYSISAFMLTMYLRNFTNFFEVVDLKKDFLDKFHSQKNKYDFTGDSDEEAIVSTILLQCVLQMICNGHAITGMNCYDSENPDILINKQDRIATAIYLSASMMNHSCDPNIMNSFWDDSIIIKATKNIHSGEEVYNCYGPYYRRMATEERKKSLKTQYHFRCECKPCTDPKLEYFVERFVSLKCNACKGPFSLKMKKCLDCESTSSPNSVNRQHDISKAEHLFLEAELCFKNCEMEKAAEQARQCFGFYKKHLYRFHDEIAKTLDLMGKIYAYLGQYKTSGECLEEHLKIIEEKFGKDSIEVAAELDKVTDIYTSYLYYNNFQKEIYEKTQALVNRTLKIMDSCSGPWTQSYKNVLEKKNCLDVSCRFRLLSLNSPSRQCK